MSSAELYCKVSTEGVINICPRKEPLPSRRCIVIFLNINVFCPRGSKAVLMCIHLQGTRVWLPHKSQVWCPGVVVSPFHAGKLVVEEEEGESRELVVTSPADLPPLRNPHILVGANDLTTLSYLHESAGELAVEGEGRGRGRGSLVYSSKREGSTLKSEVGGVANYPVIHGSDKLCLSVISC